MPITKDDLCKSLLEQDKCEKIEQKILTTLNDAELNLRELIYVLAMVGLDIGATIEQLDERLSYNVVRRRYSVEPSIGNALMAQSVDMLDEWINIIEEEQDD